MTHSTRKHPGNSTKARARRFLDEMDARLTAEKLAREAAETREREARRDFPRWLEAVDKTFGEMAKDNSRSKGERSN